MKKTYPSKISYGLLSFVIILLFFPLVLELYTKGMSRQLIVSLMIIMLPTAFVLHVFFKTTYMITGNVLNVKSSFIINKSINITDIKEITHTKSVISSPAMSFDRIIIKYGNYNDIIISPKNKLQFVKDLIAINPNIINHVTEDK